MMHALETKGLYFLFHVGVTAQYLTNQVSKLGGEVFGQHGGAVACCAGIRVVAPLKAGDKNAQSFRIISHG